MHQTIAIGISLAIAVLLHGPLAAAEVSDGNWGSALGNLIFGPLVIFFLVHTIVYFLSRMIRGREKLASFSGSRLNYIAAAITILGILGSVANQV